MTVRRDPEGAEPRILDELADFAGKDVLEIGSGEGRLTWRYAERARSVYGIDASASAVAEARTALAEQPQLRSRVTFEAMDVTAAAPPASSFDVALLAWSL